MKKVKFNSRGKGVGIGLYNIFCVVNNQVYDVIDYIITDSKNPILDKIIIQNHRGKRDTFYIYDEETSEPLFEDVTIKYRNDLIDFILE